VVGTDFNLSYEKMYKASQYINKNGAILIGTNIDRNDGKERLRPSGGSLSKLIEIGSNIGNQKNY
jgi:ribonucleotide monophosphatase NagD (HAD superfamily)